MRIIAGRLGGRNFDAPHGHRTHPMSEKMRGALFNALGDISGLSVLDAFAGSGALSFEAVSRGAAAVTSIEVEKGAHAIIQRNIKALGLENQVKAVKAYANAWSTRHQAQLFDLVLLDPPYDDLPWRDIDKLPRHVEPDGVLVVSWPANIELPRFTGFNLIRDKQYGDGQLAFYSRSQ